MIAAVSFVLIIAGTWCAIGAVSLADHDLALAFAIAAIVFGGTGVLLAVFG